ncbi:MAG: TatD family hydrolase [Muribaculaceae bacterium]|nr:TatD family hydrolase [Muribaculaceae bacterium]
MLIDTHSHLYLPEYDEDIDEVMSRSIEAGVDMVVLPGVDHTSLERMRALHSRYPDNTVIAPGIHPTEIIDDWQQQLSVIADELRNHADEFVAIGEIGIDLHYDKETLPVQMKVFDAQVKMALAYDLPIIIHSRDALDETLEVLRPYAADERLRGVFHSFPGTPDDVEKISHVLRDRDFYFGINGVVTFKNSRLRESLPAIGLDRLLVETDAPWLSPTPLRGRRNESSNVALTAKFIAEYLGIPFETLAEKTTANARKLFFSKKNA